jgi:hypothetical protein
MELQPLSSVKFIDMLQNTKKNTGIISNLKILYVAGYFVCLELFFLLLHHDF